MLREDYKAVFDRIQPDRALEMKTRVRIAAWLNGKEQAMRGGRTVAIVLAMAILLIGTAIAASLHSNILARIFGSRTPSQEAEAALVRNADQANGSGVQLTLDEYLADQSTLNLSWSVSSAREESVYYVTWAEIDDHGLSARDEAQGYVPGFPYGGSDESIGDGAIVRLTPDAGAYTSWCSFGWAHGIDRQLTARVRVCAFTTDMQAVQTQYSAVELCFAEPGDAACAAVRALEASGMLGVAADFPLCYVNSYEAFQRALGDGTESEEICAALTDSGLFQALTELTVEVEIAPPSAAADYELTSPMTFDLSDRTVILQAMRFDTASALIQYDVVLNDASGVDPAYAWYLLATPDGRVKNVEWRLSLSGEAETEERDGQTRTILHYALSSESPVTELPASLTFIPVQEIDRRDGEAPAEYWQRVAEQARAEDCFTVALK